ncbi:peptidoglycan recognition protein family protein [Maliponia aquimaris]|uniref:Peptidoglycan binding-like domain-containing protein n=1 Tax=Maliponia aquimaris TaxID=1673631 RepID=A0A238K8U5_9RHOB|nr:peptidoglycan-binding domain-containing protein [Maliponia aquimaris]SMX39269.1 hypothetical protein MAA8898_01959 [Maliponia aquimaris]
MILRFVISAMLAIFALSASAQPVQIQIAGELAPRLDNIDRAALKGYEQGRITHITFHHEGFAGDDANLFRRAAAARERQTITERVRNINHYHATQAGLGMFAYHYAVDKAGNIARGRPVSLKPGTLSTEHGSGKRADFAGHFAVVALGDFNHESLTSAGRLAYVHVMSEAQRAYRVPTANIQPHKHHAATSCPGRHILEEEDALRQMVLVYSLQAELAARGCLKGGPDGRWGPNSARALKTLQRNAGLSRQDPDDAALFALLDAPGASCR